MGKTENIASIDTHVWGPTLSSQLLFGYNYTFVNRLDQEFAASKIPSISAPGLPSTGAEVFIKWGAVADWKSRNI